MSYKTDPLMSFIGIALISGVVGGFIWVILTSIGINYVIHLFEILGGNPEPPVSLFELFYIVIISIIHGLIIPFIRKEFFIASKLLLETKEQKDIRLKEQREKLKAAIKKIEEDDELWKI